MSSSARNQAGPRHGAAPSASSRRRRAGLALARAGLGAGLLALPGCGTVSNALGSIAGSSGPAEGQPGYVRGFLGGAVADEPRAALVARDVLSAGGTAGDAAVAAGFALAVTLPSRAGLGGGGACLIYTHSRNEVEAVLFPPQPAPTGGDRPAAVPMTARGLFLLYTRNPGRPFEELLVPAEQLARFGTSTSRALAADLATVAGPLLADPGARAVFAGLSGVLREGETLTQPDLATTLATLRTAGVGDLYQGGLARRIEDGARRIGARLTVEALRPALPGTAKPVQFRVGNDVLAFLPPPADGGLAAAASFQALQAGQPVEAAARRGLAVSAAWRASGVNASGVNASGVNASGANAGGATPEALLANPPASGSLPALPASTSLVTLDRDGNAVSCAFTMNNLFGTGRVMPQLGFLAAAAPGQGRVQPPLLAATLAYNAPMKAFRYAGAGSGQEGAGLAVALPAARHLLGRSDLATAIASLPQPGRANAIGCTAYMPGDPGQCAAATDPRGAGLAVAGQQ
ncbi:gamma-glutamyltransferase family protein [Roseomonas sp. GC11]|uniref:gamma-glutamyltransferase n=1 Tax=Roseomonas sp. GC11 TaxID=2950546 RepID=UPI00210EA338|nr:gamma-glutamyltransferase [Roseomonas sp. GC11]MCQ4161309.1 gamma-glutamyltransferase family protein [Roseomonas sp. GC11]